jgi:uncharacterized protein (DUF1684 family)
MTAWSAARVATAALLTLAVLPACRVPLPVAEAQWRQAREEGVREMLAPAARAAFGGLRFYRFDERVRFRVMPTPVSPPEPLRLPASDGSIRPAHRVARVRLAFPRGEARLTLYRLDELAATDPDLLFLPFRDAGAGSVTYGAGRYVEVERLPGGVVAIDFNRAYNPDCAYGVTAQCPITPEENTLPFVVEAGELLPAGH